MPLTKMDLIRAKELCSSIVMDKSALKIQSMFDSIANSYDLANNVMTLGMAPIWRKKILKKVALDPTAKVLDCATGTGDLAFEFAKKLESNGAVYGVDFSSKMIDLAEQKKKKIKAACPILFKTCDITSLPFPNNSFDITSIAYGLRNVSDLNKALEEMARVTKKNGWLCILETGKVRGNDTLKKFIFWYSKYIVPYIGGMISKNKSAYNYLHESSSEFPSENELVEQIHQTHLYTNCTYLKLCFGASFIYLARVK